MKIEVGKYYRTRAGRKAEVYKRISSIPSPVVGFEGRIFYDHGYCSNYCWSEDGTYDPEGIAPQDLIEEWGDENEELREAYWRHLEISLFDSAEGSIPNLFNKVNELICTVNSLANYLRKKGL